MLQHSPSICWNSGEIQQWSDDCFENCLRPVKKLSVKQSVNRKMSSPEPMEINFSTIESPETAIQQEIPLEYWTFQDVFSKQLSTELPPHWPWDCAIDLLAEAILPKGKVYPSTSPDASSFFFVEKKDGGLWPCIDYRTLNSKTMYRYPLPLVPAALEQLCGARIFTKLDLWSAYMLIRIFEGDWWKIAFVTPSSHYEYLMMLYGQLTHRIPGIHE